MQDPQNRYVLAKAHAVDYACPTCNAPEDEPCRSREPHPARVKVAYDSSLPGDISRQRRRRRSFKQVQPVELSSAFETNRRKH